MSLGYASDYTKARRFSNKHVSNSTRGLKLLQFVVLIIFVIGNVIRSCDAESSGEYLQKVMIELQELNVPSSVMMHDRLSANFNNEHANYEDDQYNSYRKLSANNAHQLQHQNVQKPVINLPEKHADIDSSASNNIIQYYAVRDPATTTTSYPKVKQPEPLAFTRAELANLYKKALERGSTISLSSLAQTLNAAGGGNIPQVSGHVRLPLKYPMYNYYFFPLKSFASELKRDHQTAMVPVYAATENTENTQKQLMNPLFMAIGTFISMALLFMMGVLFLPRLPHFQLFNARLADEDDFQRLTTFVTNTIADATYWSNSNTAGSRT